MAFSIGNEHDVSSIVEVSMDKIALWIRVDVDDWTAKRAIIASNVEYRWPISRRPGGQIRRPRANSPVLMVCLLSLSVNIRRKISLHSIRIFAGTKVVLVISLFSMMVTFDLGFLVRMIYICLKPSLLILADILTILVPKGLGGGSPRSANVTE